MLRSSLVLSGVLTVVACGSLSPPRMDAGSGGGAAGNGGVGGGAATGGAGGGALTGGSGGGSAGSTGGAGGATGGGAAQTNFQWLSMSFTPTPPSPTRAREVRGLIRRPNNGEIWVALVEGLVYRAAANSNRFDTVGFAASALSSQEIIDLGAVGDEVFVLRAGSIQGCRGTCAAAADFTTVTAPSIGVSHRVAMCSSATQAFFVSQNNAITELYQLTHTGQTPSFVQVSPNLMTGHGSSCFIAPSGDVYIPGDDGVAVWFATGGSAVEPYDYQGHPGANWFSVTAIGSGANLTAFAVGGGSGARFAQRAQGVWTSFAPVTSGNVIRSVLALSPTEFLAGGMPSNSGDSIYRWNGTQFTPLTPRQTTGLDVHVALAASANEVFFAGETTGFGSYVVLHGTR